MLVFRTRNGARSATLFEYCDKNVIVLCSEQVNADQNAAELSPARRLKNQMQSRELSSPVRTRCMIFKTGGWQVSLSPGLDPRSLPPFVWTESTNWL
jgi:hypothetical protein